MREQVEPTEPRGTIVSICGCGGTLSNRIHTESDGVEKENYIKYENGK